MIDLYLEHRAAREAQIVRALQRGPLTAAEVVARVYDPLSEGLKPAALETVTAHLIKLRKEGRVDERDGTWSHRS